MPIHPENKHRYPKDWKAISYRIRFERAEGRCEFEDDGVRCEARHGLPHPITGSIVILTTAHLDHTPENCDDDNLKAGCQMHHLAYDREHHAENRKRRKAEEQKRILDKAGQLAFLTQVFGPVAS